MNMDQDSSEGLSLFSGMIFNSDSSTQTKEQSHQTKQEKPASTELAEAGLDFHFKQPLFESSKDEHVDKTNIHKEIQSNNKAGDQENIGGNLVQQGKKKKKAQAKRPGYARDSKFTISDEKNGSLSKSSNQEKHVEDPKDCLSAKAETMQESDVHPLEQLPDCTKLTESINQTSTIQPGEDESVQAVKLDDDNDEIHSDKGDSIEKETKSCDFHQLYSIGTPSSSEENLSTSEEPTEEETLNIEPIDERNSNRSPNINLQECPLNTNKENTDNNEIIVQSFQHEDVLELQTMSKTSGFKDKEEFEMEERSVNQGNVVVAKDDKERHKNEKFEKTYELSVDAEDKLAIMEQNIQFQISSLKEDEECLANLTAYLIKNYSNVETAFLDKQQELNNLIQDESNAIVDDNYDLAEELAIKIQQAKEDLDNAKYKIPGGDVKVQETLKLSGELAVRALSIRREVQSSLEELREEQVAVLDHHNEENSSKMSKEKQRLNLERQRIERNHAHLVLDSEHLKKEENALEEEINEKTEEFVAHKKELMKKHQQIRQEISDLEEKLETLKLKESRCRDDISVEELKIAEILEEFLPQRDALDLQRKDLENEQKLLDEQQEALTSSQEAYNNVIDEWNRRKSRLSEFLDSVQSAIDSNNSMISNLENKRGEIEEFQCLKHLTLNADPVLDKLKSRAKQSHQQIKTLHAKIHLSNRTVTSLRKSLSEIETQISDRNEAKEIAKRERNFKEAKRLKEESEALNIEGVDNQKKLENVLQDLNNDNELLKNEEKDFEKISEELKEEEFKSAIQLVNSAAQVLQELERNVARYSSNDLLLTLLTAEIATCQNLIKELCLKHGIDAPVSDFQVKKQDTNEMTSNTDDIEVPSENLTVDKERLQCRLDELEIKLEAVVELEDFDEAERIQQQIEELKGKL